MMYQISSTTVSEVLRDDSTIVEEVEIRVTENIHNETSNQKRKAQTYQTTNQTKTTSQRNIHLTIVHAPLSNQTYEGIQASQQLSKII